MSEYQNSINYNNLVKLMKDEIKCKMEDIYTPAVMYNIRCIYRTEDKEYILYEIEVPRQKMPIGDGDYVKCKLARYMVEYDHGNIEWFESMYRDDENMSEPGEANMNDSDMENIDPEEDIYENRRG